MEYTGERYVPQLLSAQLGYEHWHRYLFACELIRDKVVLDLGCGEGYGSYLLSQSARCVEGLDASEETIRFAESRYVSDNLQFKLASADDLPGDWTGKFDVVVAFKMVDHMSVDDRVNMLAEVRRVLKPEGMLIVSTSNAQFSNGELSFPIQVSPNDLDCKEFRNLLGEWFTSVQTLGQKVSPVSYIRDFCTESSSLTEFRLSLSRDGFSPSTDAIPFDVLITLCTNSSAAVSGASILIDVSDELTRQRESRIHELYERVISLVEALRREQNENQTVRAQLSELNATAEALRNALADAEARASQLSGTAAGQTDEERKLVGAREIESEQHRAELVSGAESGQHDQMVSARLEALTAVTAHLKHVCQVTECRNIALSQAIVIQAHHMQNLQAQGTSLTDTLRQQQESSRRAATFAEELNDTIARQSSALEAAENRLRRLRCTLEEHAQALHEAEIRSARASQELAKKATELSRVTAARELEVQELRDALATWKTHWTLVQSTYAWRYFVLPVRRIRRVFAPEESTRERLWFWIRKRLA